MMGAERTVGAAVYSEGATDASRATRHAPQGEDESAQGREVESCPECGGNIVTKRGEQVCADCSLVISETDIDHGPEWRHEATTDSTSESQRRVGAPLTERFADRGLATEIGHATDARGTPISDQKRQQLSRLRTWNVRCRRSSSQERTLHQATQEITRMGGALGVPDPTCEKACYLFRRALSEDIIVGWSIECMSAAALYAACRQEDVPRCLSEIEDVARDVSRAKIGKGYRKLAAELGINPLPQDPAHFLPRFASRLDMSEAAVRTARQIIERAREADHADGKRPTALAGGALYIAGKHVDEPRSQREIADVCHVQQRTILNRYQGLEQYYDPTDDTTLSRPNP